MTKDFYEKIRMKQKKMMAKIREIGQKLQGVSDEAKKRHEDQATLVIDTSQNTIDTVGPSKAISQEVEITMELRLEVTMNTNRSLREDVQRLVSFAEGKGKGPMEVEHVEMSRDRATNG